MSDRNGCWTVLMGLFCALLIVGEVGRGILVNPNDALGAADTLGFSNATITGTNWLFAGLSGCDGGDALAVDLRAKNANGQTVRVVACSGFPFKGWTVRVK